MILLIGQSIDFFHRPVRPDAPALIAATNGLDYITRNRLLALGKSIGVPVPWRLTKSEGYSFFQLLAPTKDGDAISNLYLRDEDLNANALCLWWILLEDRYFSLPRNSFTVDLPLSQQNLSRQVASQRLGGLLRLATTRPTFRLLKQDGYTPVRLSVAVRPIGVDNRSASAIDVMCELRKGPSRRACRMQIIGGASVDCGILDAWPESYANGLRKHGSTKRAFPGTEHLRPDGGLPMIFGAAPVTESDGSGRLRCSQVRRNGRPFNASYRSRYWPMPVTSYHTAGGRIRGQSSGGARADYLADALGSVAATVGQAGAVQAAFRNRPYGDRLAKTGAGADPRFQWAGETGSRATGLPYAKQYNRARHYGSRQAGWTSLDALWPRERPYAYVEGNPVNLIDPSGHAPESDCRSAGTMKFVPKGTLSQIRPLKGGSVEVIAYAAVYFECEIECKTCNGKCPEPDFPCFPRWAFGCHKTSDKVVCPSPWDSVDLCDLPKKLDGCRYLYRGVDSPGINGNEFQNCEPYEKYQIFEAKDFPLRFEYRFRTCCTYPLPPGNPCSQSTFPTFDCQEVRTRGVRIYCSKPTDKKCLVLFDQL